MTKTLIALLGVAMFATSCSSDIENASSESETKTVTFTATHSNNNATSRSYVADNGTDIYWEDKDQIFVYYYNEGTTVGKVCSIYRGYGTNTLSFGAEVPSEVNNFLMISHTGNGTTPVYTGDMDNKKFKDVEIPYQQIANDGTYDPAAAKMIGYVENYYQNMSVQFKNVCSFVKITTDNQAYKKIEFVADAQVAGIFDVSLNGDNNVVVTNTTSSTNPGAIKNVIELTGDIKANTTYYLAIAPCTVYNLRCTAYSDEACTTGKQMKLTGTTAHTLAASSVLSLPAMSDWTTTIDGTVGSKDGHSWIQLWSGGAKFAEMNVGATTVAGLGNSMYYTVAVVSGDDYAWGKNWKTPSKDEIGLTSTDNVSQEFTYYNGGRGGKFTGKDDYANNTLFMPMSASSVYGSAQYWTSTAHETSGYAYYFGLNYYNNNFECFYNTNYTSVTYYVRPVLNETEN